MIRQIHVFKTRGEYLAWKSINFLAATTLAYIIAEDIFIGKLLNDIKNNTFSSGVVKFSISANTLTITAPTGYSVYYTTDGSTPTAESTAYSDPISLASIASDTTIKMIGVKNGKTSKVVEVTIVKPGNVTQAAVDFNKINFTCTTVGATFISTIDNWSHQAEGSSRTLSASGTVKVKAVLNGVYGAESSASYTIPAAPVITDTATGVTITCATTGATIKYQIGSGAEQTYSSAVTASDGAVIKAWAVKDHMKSSTTTKTHVVPSLCKFVQVDSTIQAMASMATSDILAMIAGTYSGAVNYNVIDVPTNDTANLIPLGTTYSRGMLIYTPDSITVKSWENTEALVTPFFSGADTPSTDATAAYTGTTATYEGMTTKVVCVNNVNGQTMKIRAAKK